MRVSLKLFLLLWLGILLLIGGILYSAYSKLEPESLMVLLNQQIDRNYPGARLNVESMEYKFSVDFSLELKKLSVRKDATILIEAEKVELKIPWWVLLFNKGSVQVGLNDLHIYLAETESGKILSAKSSSPVPSVVITVPQYLIDATYTVRAQNVSLRELGGGRTFFLISKFLVREFQYGKNSAFEINIPIQIQQNKKSFSSDLWLFGDVTPRLHDWNMNYRGELKTKDSLDGLQFDDLVLDGKAQFSPSSFNIQSTLVLENDRRPIGRGSFRSGVNVAEANLSFSELPLEYLKFLGEEIKNPFLTYPSGTAAGEIKVSHQSTKEHPLSFSGKIQFPGSFTVDSVALSGTWLMNFENQKWETSFLTPAGDISFFRRAVVDFGEGLVRQYTQEIGYSGVNLQQFPLPVPALDEFMNTSGGAFHSSYVMLKKCQNGPRKIDGQFRFGVTPEQKFYQVDLKSGTDPFVLNFQEKSGLRRLSTSFQNFPWFNLHFLRPIFDATDGTLTGKLEGEWQTTWSDGTWLGKIKLENTRELSGTLSAYVAQAALAFDLEAQLYPNQNWDVIMNRGIMKVNGLTMSGTDPAVISGVLNSDLKQRSHLTLTYPKNKKWKAIKKELSSVFWQKEGP